jgi:hypothetical protein
MKNRYSHGFPLIGRSWIDVRLTASRANGSISRNSAPASSRRIVNTIEVRSRPLGGGGSPPITRKRVLLSRRSSMPQRHRRARRPRPRAAIRSPRTRARGRALRRGGRARHLLARAAGQLLIEPAPALRERLRVGDHAAHVVERPALREQRVRHAQHALAHTVTVALAERVERLGDDALGGVLDGTIPSCARPASTAANTSEMLATPHSTASAPKCSRAAWCENVPSGPEVGDADRLLERARAEMISRNTGAIAVGRERTGLPARRRSTIRARASARRPRCRSPASRGRPARRARRARSAARGSRRRRRRCARAAARSRSGSHPDRARSIRFGTRHGENALTP